MRLSIPQAGKKSKRRPGGDDLRKRESKENRPEPSHTHRSARRRITVERRPPAHRTKHSIQSHTPPDISRHIQILAVVDRWLALLESTFGNDFERQLALPHPRGVPALAEAAPGLLGQKQFFLPRCVRWRRRQQARNP